MNGYLLLQKPVEGSGNPTYRGTSRPGPMYVDELPVDSSVNQLWIQELELMTADYFPSLEEAKRVQEIYANVGIYFDLVLVMEKEEALTDEECLQFMGCDISHISHYSLLSWNLNFEQPAHKYFHQRENPVYQPLLLLIQKYFCPLLNSYGLLPTIEDADFFLRVATTMTVGFGAVWESTEYGPFSVVKMYMVVPH